MKKVVLSALMIVILLTGMDVNAIARAEGCDDAVSVQVGHGHRNDGGDGQIFVSALLSSLVAVDIHIGRPAYLALGDSSIDIEALLTALSARHGGGLGAGAILDADVSVRVLLEAFADAADQKGDAECASELRRIAALLVDLDGTVRLSDILFIDASTTLDAVLQLRVDALAIVLGALTQHQHAYHTAPRFVTLPTGLLDGSSLADVRLSVEVLSPARITLGRAGASVALPSLRLRLDVALLDALRDVELGLDGLLAAKLSLGRIPLVVEVRAGLGEIVCADFDRGSVAIEARAGALAIGLGAVDHGDKLDEIHSADLAKLSLKTLLGIGVEVGVGAHAFVAADAGLLSRFQFCGPFPQTLGSLPSVDVEADLVAALCAGISVDPLTLSLLGIDLLDLKLAIEAKLFAELGLIQRLTLDVQTTVVSRLLAVVGLDGAGLGLSVLGIEADHPYYDDGSQTCGGADEKDADRQLCCEYCGNACGRGGDGGGAGGGIGIGIGGGSGVHVDLDGDGVIDVGTDSEALSDDKYAVRGGGLCAVTHPGASMANGWLLLLVAIPLFLLRRRGRTA